MPTTFRQNIGWAGAHFDSLKEKLQQSGTMFLKEQRYGLYQIIYLNNVAHDNNWNL